MIRKKLKNSRKRLSITYAIYIVMHMVCVFCYAQNINELSAEDSIESVDSLILQLEDPFESKIPVIVENTQEVISEVKQQVVQRASEQLKRLEQSMEDMQQIKKQQEEGVSNAYKTLLPIYHAVVPVNEDLNKKVFTEAPEIALKGIIWDTNNPYALIGDQILSPGEEIEDGGLLVSIERSSIVVDYGNNRFTINVKEPLNEK